MVDPRLKGNRVMPRAFRYRRRVRRPSSAGNNRYDAQVPSDCSARHRWVNACKRRCVQGPRVPVRQSSVAGTGRNARRGGAAVELACLLPLLLFLFVIAVDFSSVFYFSLTLQNCARAGAIYASDPAVADESPFTSAEDAALADATNLSPSPTVTQDEGTDVNGRAYVEVTVSYPYGTVTAFPGVPSQMNLTRSVRMYRAAISPDTQ